MRKIILLLLLPISVWCQNFHLKPVETKTDASFRGLSVVNDNIAWVSGSKGWVGSTSDGGAHWSFGQVKGFETVDFRSLYAFDDKNAVIANAGSPANILRTTDGGQSWKLVYKNELKEAFFDGIDFWNDKEGLIYGDPIGGRMLMLKTSDGGNSWQEVPEKSRPALKEGEASFAASGTNIRCIDKNKVMIATGGLVSRLWTSLDKGTTWTATATPILQGSSTTGIFSFAYLSSKLFFIVGGDYKADTLSVKHIFYTQDGGQHWLAPKVPTRGYRECVEYIDKKNMIAAGPKGIDLSHDGGVTWIPFSDEKLFHAVRKARTGSLMIVSGGNGKVSLLY